MKPRTFSSEVGIEWILGIIISELTYEEYIRMGANFDDMYLSLRDILFYNYTLKNLMPRYQYKKSKKLAIEQVEKYRNDKSRIAFYNFVNNIRKNLLI